MEADKNFVVQKPINQFLSTIVDYYFYIDISVRELLLRKEFILPFPRITFGYFFEHPFLVTNHTLNQSIIAQMIISRISIHKISVQPETEHVRILGAHVRPYCLAYLTNQPVQMLPWVINTVDLFKEVAINFKHRADQCIDTDSMFNEVEKIFLDTLLVKDLSIITSAVKLIDESRGDIRIIEIADKLNISDKTLRLHFDNHVGCSPKEYVRLVKLKQVAWQMQHTDSSLSSIAHDNKYFDQAHFIHEVKNITGKGPKQLKKEMPNFRFLQF